MFELNEQEGETHGSPSDSDLLTLTEARDLLGIGHTKMSQLIKTGEETHGAEGLPSTRSSLDHRLILVQRKDVESLLRISRNMSVEEAREQLGVSEAKMGELIKSGRLIILQNPLHKKRKIVDPDSLQALMRERHILSRAQSHDL